MYICQICGMDLDSVKFPPVWRTDLTGRTSAGNVCPSCLGEAVQSDYDQPVGVSERSLNSAARREEVRQRNSDRKKAGEKLSDLTHNRYFESVPVAEIDAILAAHGFNTLEPVIYCGREGRVNESVGRDVYLTMTWYKMESGRYEIVAYLAL